MTEPLYKQKWNEFIEAYENEFLNGGCKDFLVEEYRKIPDDVYKAYYEMGSRIIIYVISSKDDIDYDIVLDVENKIHDKINNSEIKFDFITFHYYPKWFDKPEEREGRIYGKCFYVKEEQCSDTI